MNTAPKPNPFYVSQDLEDESGGVYARTEFEGYWTHIYTDIVYDGENGGSGSMPRDVYDDNEEYLKRSALHGEVIEPLCVLLNVEAAEQEALSSGFELIPGERQRRHIERVKAIRALMKAHWLTDTTRY